MHGCDLWETSLMDNLNCGMEAHASSFVPIMLLKLPIMLWSSAPEFCQLCSIYVPHVKYNALHIQYILFFILLQLQNHEY